MKTLYSSIVESHFQYCCSVWGCCNSTDILQLPRLQNRAARVLTNSQFDAPSKPLIQSLGWQTIGQLIDRQSKLTVFKCLNDLAPRYLSEVFTKNVDCASRNLRNTSTDLRLPLESSSTEKNAFRSVEQKSGIFSPQRLSRQLHLMPSRSKFKSREVLKYFRLFFILDYKDILFIVIRFSFIYFILEPLHYILDGGPLENQHLLKGYPPKNVKSNKIKSFGSIERKPFKSTIMCNQLKVIS